MNKSIIILEVDNYLQSFGASLELPHNIEFGQLATNALMISKNKIPSENLVFNWLKEKKYIQNINIINNFIIFDIEYNLNLVYCEKNFMKDSQEKINLEFSSPNPTGPMHIGHLRGTIIGAVLFNLLKYAGYNINSEMIINDCGRQVEEFYKSVLFYKDQESKLYYEGEYIKDIANEFHYIPTMREVIESQVNENIKTLNKLNINHEIITYESQLYCDSKVLDLLKPYLYIGKIVNQKEEGEMLILRTSAFGDSQDRVFKNKDYTYFAKDIFYHYDKLQRGFTKQMIVLGEDHIGHLCKLVPVLKEVFNIELKVIKVSNVTYKNQKMSKRTGKILTIDEILPHFDSNLLKIKMLERTINKPMDINFSEGSNTLFNLYYIMQYELPKSLNKTLNISCNSITKRELYRRLLFWPKILKNAVKHMDSHMVYDFLCQIIHFTTNVIQENYNDEIILIAQKVIQDACEICQIKYKNNI